MSQQDMDPLRDAIADELGLARDGIGYEEVGVADEIVAKYVAPLRAERDLLLWLHAEAVWQRQRDNEFHMRVRFDVEAVLDEALGTEEEDGAGEGLAADVALLARRAAASEASRRDWAAEAMRLQENAPAEPWACDRCMAADPEDGLCAPCYRQFTFCSCLTAEQAAVVVAGGFSLPECAVHPEADREDAALLAIAEARAAADTGERHSLDDVAREFGVDLTEPSVHPEADR